jgi:protein-S-isoprenylcysteine O-methyltransferase Ste14
MNDMPGSVLTATIWVYWVGAGVMVVWVRKKTRESPGLLPKQRLERLMWLVWVPLVMAWNVLPYLAITQRLPFLAVPELALAHSVLSVLRWAASLLAVVCVLVTIECWVRMGKNWSMGVIPNRRNDLVTTGLYARVRHPIYALSVLLMLCSVIIVPTPMMIAVAIPHILLMMLKARNEERFLLTAHGAMYADYCRRTGRFVPRLTSRDT